MSGEAERSEPTSGIQDETIRSTQTEVDREPPNSLALELEATGVDGVANPESSTGMLEVGDAIGRYVVLGTLGVGGMGVVHAAYDPELDRKLAIKLLRRSPNETRGDVEVRARLLREAQAIARLNHPNVVAVHDVGVHEGHVFVAMEFVDGGTLRQWLQACPKPPAWPEVLERMIPAGRGLAAAHAAGLVHRDFKPANVLLGSDGRPRVADFGIARSLAQPHQQEQSLTDSARSQLDELLADAPTLTRTGVLVGTPAYMAPEQFGGAQVDARADQFAFCVSLYEALYGERPFAGDTLAVLVHNITRGKLREDPRVIKVPAWLRKIVLRGLAKRSDDRWPDMQTLLDALEHRPQRTGRVIAGSFVALAVLAGGAAIANDRKPTVEVCSDAEDALGDTWSASSRASVLGNLAARETEALREAGPQVAARLDSWARTWRDTWRDTCEATHVRAEQSSELLDRRMACLSRSRQRVDAYARLLAGADDALARSAVAGLDELVEHVADPRRCAGALTGEDALPETARERDEVERLTHGLDRVVASLLAGEWQLAKQELDTLEPEIEHAARPALAAEFAYLRAQLYDGTRELDRAETHYRDAFVAALKIGDEMLAAQSARDLARMIAEWDARQDEALEQLRIADALAVRLDDAELRGSVALARAVTLELRGDFEPALTAAKQAASALAEARGPDSAKVAEARYRESMIDYRLGRLDDARAALDAAVAGFGRAHGRNHPIALQLLNADGVLALGAGDWPRAIASFSELAARKQAVFGPDHLDVSDALANLGAAQYQAGEFEAARVSQTRALEIREREMGPNNLWVGHSLANLALAEARLGRGEQAEQAARRALAIIVEVRGPDHHDTMLSHALLAEVLEVAGDDTSALAEFDAATELAERHGSELQRAEFRLQTALALVHLGRLEQASELLDLVGPFVTGEQSVGGLELLYEYMRGRIAEQRGDAPLAQQHRANARAVLDSSHLGSMLALDEAREWVTRR